MPYKSHRKALLIATVTALALGTMVSLGAIYGLNKHTVPSDETVGFSNLKIGAVAAAGVSRSPHKLH
jgi:hypothetical protein